MNLNILYKNIGKKYAKFDKDGLALGCVMPVYLLFPDAKRYEFIDNIDFILEKLKLDFNVIEKKELKEGDVIVFSYKRFNHLSIYAGNDRIFHCTENNTLQLSRLSNKKNAKYYFRYKGIN
jgi:hypothetical protein